MNMKRDKEEPHDRGALDRIGGGHHRPLVQKGSVGLRLRRVAGLRAQAKGEGGRSSCPRSGGKASCGSLPRKIRWDAEPLQAPPASI